MCDVWSQSSTPNSIWLASDWCCDLWSTSSTQNSIWLAGDWCVITIFKTKLHYVGYSVFLALEAFCLLAIYHKSTWSRRRLGLGFYMLSRLPVLYFKSLLLWFRQWAADILCTVILVEDYGCTELASVKLSASTLSGCVQGCTWDSFFSFFVLSLHTVYCACKISLYTCSRTENFRFAFWESLNTGLEKMLSNWRPCPPSPSPWPQKTIFSKELENRILKCWDFSAFSCTGTDRALVWFL